MTTRTHERAPVAPQTVGALAAEPEPLPTGSAASFVDRPFGAPLDAVLDLPFPPSVNELWRSHRGRVHKSVRYKRWLSNADLAVIAARTYRSTPKMSGAFEAEILLSVDRRRGDCDNYAKAPLDWAQARGFVSNDKHADAVTTRWVKPERAPTGCRLILKPSEGI